MPRLLSDAELQVKFNMNLNVNPVIFKKSSPSNNELVPENLIIYANDKMLYYAGLVDTFDIKSYPKDGLLKLFYVDKVEEAEKYISTLSMITFAIKSSLLKQFIDYFVDYHKVHDNSPQYKSNHIISKVLTLVDSIIYNLKHLYINQNDINMFLSYYHLFIEIMDSEIIKDYEEEDFSFSTKHVIELLSNFNKNKD